MPLPFFYIENIPFDQNSFELSEKTSKHIIQVLRMKQGEQLQLTNGKGKLVTVGIVSENKKTAEVKVLSSSNISHRTSNITIAISLVKNTSRFEWFLEKATEIGVSAIIPLYCQRTEKQNFRHDRMQNLLVSAMIQSQQTWLPVLHKPTKFIEVIKHAEHTNKFIAHCNQEDKEKLRVASPDESSIILIGPEGDFTFNEIEIAKQNNYKTVTLGSTRLRTETAAVVAAVLLNQ